MRHLAILVAMGLGSAGVAQAAPLASAANIASGVEGAAEAVKWKGHKGHKWKGGHRGRHYGWSRGRHKGWYKQARRRAYFRYY